MPDFFFNEYTDFNNIDTNNKSLSKFYYEMSGGSFKLVADPFKDPTTGLPVVIKIDPTSSNSDPNYNFSYNATSWQDCNTRVIAKIKELYGGFNWSDYDNRRNNPYYQDYVDALLPDNKPDYIIAVYRYKRSASNVFKPAPGADSWVGSQGGFSRFGLAGPNSGIQIGNYTFNSGAGFTNASGGGTAFGKQGFFLHEISHELFSCPHYMGANATIGARLQGMSNGYGMMAGYGRQIMTANGFERWLLGWIELTSGAAQDNTDIIDVSSLVNGGVYTLRDFVTTGDVIRVKVPGSNEYLWIENHQGESVFDESELAGQGFPGMIPNQEVIPNMEPGIHMFVENVLSNRNLISSSMGWALGKVNGLKVLSAQGNYDYERSIDAQPISWDYYWRKVLYTFERKQSNAFSGTNPLYYFLDDFPLDGTHTNASNSNDGIININGGGLGLTQGMTGLFDARLIIKEKQGADENYLMGNTGGRNEIARTIFNRRSDAFKAGDEIGISGIQHVNGMPYYDKVGKRLNPVILNGLTVKILNEDATTGNITVQIIFDDYDISQSANWCGNLIFPANQSQYYDIDIKSGVGINLLRSGTATRHTLSAEGDFANDTKLSCELGARLHLSDNSVINIGETSNLNIKQGAKLIVHDGAIVNVLPGGELKIDDARDLLLHSGGKIKVFAGGTLVIGNINSDLMRLGVQNIGTGIAELEIEGNLVFENNANLDFDGPGRIAFHGPSATLTMGDQSSIILKGISAQHEMLLFGDQADIVVTDVDLDMDYARIQFVGHSAFTMLDADVLINHAEIKGDNVNVDFGLNLVNCKTVDINNLLAYESSHPLRVSNADDLRIENSEFRDCHVGLEITDMATKFFLLNSKIERCVNGLRLSNNVDCYARNLNVLGGGYYGVSVDKTRLANFVNCDIQAFNYAIRTDILTAYI